MGEDEKLWVFQASAISTGVGRYQRGRRHPLLMFAVDADVGRAKAEVLARVAESGWTDINVSRSGEVLPENIGDDGYLRSAADNALGAVDS